MKSRSLLVANAENLNFAERQKWPGERDAAFGYKRFRFVNGRSKQRVYQR